MAHGEPKSNSETPQNLTASDSDEQAVENFSFDVSPNIRADLADSKSSSTARKRPARRQRAAATKIRQSHRATVSEPVSDIAKPTEKPAPHLSDATVAPKHKTARRRNRRAAPASTSTSLRVHAKDTSLRSTLKERRRRPPPWLVSLGVHAVVLLVMSLLTFASIEPEEFLLWADAPPIEEIEEFQELEIETNFELEEQLDTEFPTKLEDPGASSLGELSAESLMPELSQSGFAASDSIGEWGTLFGDEGDGLEEVGLGEGDALTSFFGAKSVARRVVFVIDNTGSMRAGGLETVIAEMLKSVDELTMSQEFYVLFFSDQVYPLFFPKSVSAFLRPSDENKKQLRDWLDTVEFCTGGVWQLSQALEGAYELKPDVVYLLSDGRHWDRVRADYKVAAVKRLRTKANPRGIIVHTLGMGCETDFDRENLGLIAKVNGGTFREVEVSPAMVDVANAKNRPWHDYDTGPGKVWGTLVPRRR